MADSEMVRRAERVSDDLFGPSTLSVRVRCGSVELKLTLTKKLQQLPLRDAVAIPFLKAYNKKCPDAPASWETLKCVQINGWTMLERETLEEKEARDVLDEGARVLLVATIDADLPTSFLEAARTSVAARKVRAFPSRLLRVAEEAVAAAAALQDGDGSQAVDADLGRRTKRAFEVISGDELALRCSRASVLKHMMGDHERVRKLAMLAFSEHASYVAMALKQIAVDEAASVSRDEFARFFAAVSATACAPTSAAAMTKEELGEDSGMDGFMSDLLKDPKCSVKRIH